MTMEKKKLLVLGSDYGTLAIVQQAHEMGLYVVVADYLPTTPTKEAADEAWTISTPDIDALETKCREQKIDAVITGASDFNINNSRKLCKRLGLPYYAASDHAWETANNKAMFKETCKEVGAPIATDYLLSDALSDEELAPIAYPVVVKPVDKSGNRGMNYCNNREELINAYKYARTVSDNSRIIVERQFHGPEFVANYVLANGKANLLFLSKEHHEPGQKANLYSVINTTSKHLKQYRAELNEKVKEVFKRAGCRDGIAWVECMLDDDGHFYLIEMGYRYAGEMTYTAYKYVSGFDAIKWMIEIALGIKHSEKDLPAELDKAYSSIAASYLIFTNKGSTISVLEGKEKIMKMPNVMVDIPRKVGSEVRPFATMAVFRIFGESAEAVCKTIKEINDVFVVKDESGNDLIIKFDDYDAIINDFNDGLAEFGLER